MRAIATLMPRRTPTHSRPSLAPFVLAARVRPVRLGLDGAAGRWLLLERVDWYERSAARVAGRRVGRLAARALPLERAVARVCREAGAAVAHNVRVADMNIDVPVVDDRRIEVVANGLPLWHGAQLAVDATLVFPVTRAGEPQTRADVEPGRAVSSAAERKRRYTYPELTRARRCRLVVVGLEVGGRFGTEAATFPRPSHGTALLPCRPGCARLPNPPGFPDGQRYWLLPHSGHMPLPARAPARRRGQRRVSCAGAS